LHHWIRVYHFAVITGGAHAGTSNVATASPAAAISDLVAIVNNSQVSFTFSAATGATSVELQQTMNGSGYTTATTVPLDASSTTATATNLLMGFPYSFRLVVVGGPHAGISNVVSGMMMIIMPPMPF
jgi:hypothetical protein